MSSSWARSFQSDRHRASTSSSPSAGVLASCSLTCVTQVAHPCARRAQSAVGVGVGGLRRAGCVPASAAVRRGARAVRSISASGAASSLRPTRRRAAARARSQSASRARVAASCEQPRTVDRQLGAQRARRPRRRPASGSRCRAARRAHSISAARSSRRALRSVRSARSQRALERRVTLLGVGGHVVELAPGPPGRARACCSALPFRPQAEDQRPTLALGEEAVALALEVDDHRRCGEQRLDARALGVLRRRARVPIVAVELAQARRQLRDASAAVVVGEQGGGACAQRGDRLPRGRVREIRRPPGGLHSSASANPAAALRSCASMMSALRCASPARRSTRSGGAAADSPCCNELRMRAFASPLRASRTVSPRVPQRRPVDRADADSSARVEGRRPSVFIGAPRRRATSSASAAASRTNSRCAARSVSASHCRSKGAKVRARKRLPGSGAPSASLCSVTMRRRSHGPAAPGRSSRA